MPNLREIIALAESVGLTVTQGKKHRKILTPDGRMVAVLPTRRSNDRGRHADNVMATIRREGRKLDDRSR